jgi:hypothetical protein
MHHSPPLDRPAEDPVPRRPDGLHTARPSLTTTIRRLPIVQLFDCMCAFGSLTQRVGHQSVGAIVESSPGARSSSCRRTGQPSGRASNIIGPGSGNLFMFLSTCLSNIFRWDNMFVPSEYVCSAGISVYLGEERVRLAGDVPDHRAAVILPLPSRASTPEDCQVHLPPQTPPPPFILSRVWAVNGLVRNTSSAEHITGKQPCGTPRTWSRMWSGAASQTSWCRFFEHGRMSLPDKSTSSASSPTYM